MTKNGPTNKVFYDAIMSLTKDVGKIDGKLTVTKRVSEETLVELKEANESLNSHGDRITSLEKDNTLLFVRVSENSGAIHLLQKQYEDELKKKLKSAKNQNQWWFKHAVWLGVVVIVALLQATGLISFNIPM